MPRLSASSFIRLIEAMAGGFLRVIGNIPKALRWEIDYYLGKRRSALLILTWGCTSRCSSCTVWKRPRDSAAELTLEEWLETARKLVSRGVRTVELFGGDVFLRKDVLIPLARELKSLGCTIHMPTNCNLIDRDTAKAMVDNLDFLYLSVDGIEDLHDHMRGIPGTFNKVINALEWFREGRGNRNRPILICNTTVSRYNVHDLSQIADFAAEAGFDEIHFEYVGEFTPDIVNKSAIGDYVPLPIYIQEGDSCLIPEHAVADLRGQLREARRWERPDEASHRPFRVVTINTDVLPDGDLVSGAVPGRRCFQERTEVVIDPYGNVVPCAFFDTFSIGSIRNRDFEKSWVTPARKRFRVLRDDGRLEMCRYCIHKIARNHTMRDIIKRAYLHHVRDRLDRVLHRLTPEESSGKS